MTNQKYKEFGPIANDAEFDVTDEGDVVPTYVGVNSPVGTPRGDMPHHRDDVTGNITEKSMPEKDILVGPNDQTGIKPKEFDPNGSVVALGKVLDKRSERDAQIREAVSPTTVRSAKTLKD